MTSVNLHPEYASIIEKYITEKHVDVVPDPTEDPEVQEAANVDRFGFYHPNGLQEKKESEEKKQQQARRLEKWREMTDEWPKIDSTWQRIFRNGYASEKLTRRIFKGIPQQFRMIVWPLLLCVPEVKSRNRNLYSKMLARALATSNDLGQIDLDINRTFRNTVYFRARYGSRQQALFRILAAYSVFNTEVGYCQGMSELVGLFLTYIVEEEDAFWALSQLMTGPRHRLHGIFVSGFPGLQRLFTHHERVVKRLLPPIHKHFAQQQMVTSTYALKWFMQCFLDRLPVSLVLRLWDIYLLEGEKILIAQAYNILKMHKKRLLRMDQTQITCFFQDELVKDFQYEDDVVIESLKDCLEQLRRNKLDQPPPPTADMLPRRSVGSLGPDSIWQSQPNLRILDGNEASRGPNVKPNLKIPLSPDGSLRPTRGKRAQMNRDVALSPIPQRGPVRLYNSASRLPSNIPSSAGFATSASILTVNAVQNRQRVYPSEAYSRRPTLMDNTNYHSPSPSTTTSSVFPSSETTPNSVPRQSSYPVRSSPKFLRARQTNRSPNLRLSLGHQFSPTTSTPTSGYATTEGRRHQVIRESTLVPSSKSNDLRSPPPDRTLQLSTSDSTNDVVLISVRPRDQMHNRQVVAKKSFERIYVDRMPVQEGPNGQMGQWSSERVLCDDVILCSPSARSSSTSGAIDQSDQPWHMRSDASPASESTHRTTTVATDASTPRVVVAMTTKLQRHKSVSRAESDQTVIRDVLVPTSSSSSTALPLSPARPRVLRLDSSGQPLDNSTSQQTSQTRESAVSNSRPFGPPILRGSAAQKIVTHPARLMVISRSIPSSVP